MDKYIGPADADAEMLDAVEKWLARDVRPHVLRLEHADEYPHEMVAQMAELGLFGAHGLLKELGKSEHSPKGIIQLMGHATSDGSNLGHLRVVQKNALNLPALRDVQENHCSLLEEASVNARVEL
jgi:alkylation response protein AidB-like acyl-CoA dehydrogenase